MCKIVGIYQCRICFLPVLIDSDPNEEGYSSYVPSKFFEGNKNQTYYLDVQNGVEVHHGPHKALFKNRVFSPCPGCLKERSAAVSVFELNGFQYEKDENIS